MAPSTARQIVDNPAPVQGRGALREQQVSWRDRMSDYLREKLGAREARRIMTLVDVSPAAALFAGNEARIAYNEGNPAAAGAMMAASVLPVPARRGAGRVAQEVIEEAPAVVNRLYSARLLGPEYKPGDVLPAYGQRNISSPLELDDLMESGFMRAREGSKKGAQKYFTMTDEPLPPAGNRGGLVVRVPSGKIPDGRAVSAKDVELWDAQNEAWVPVQSDRARAIRQSR
jgi:hypothetical protein